MADPTVPPVLADIIKDLKRRVTNLENSQRLVASSIQGGKLRVLDADGDPIVSIGENDPLSGTVNAEFYDGGGDIVARLGQTSSGFTGLEIGFNPSGSSDDTWLLATSSGIAWPYFGWSWQKADDFKAITSGSFTTAWSTVIELSTYIELGCRVVVTADVGTTGEFRLNIPGVGVTSSVSVGSGAQVNQTFRWNPLGSFVAGSAYSVILEARRVSGAGNVNVYNPTDVITGGIAGANNSGI